METIREEPVDKHWNPHDVHQLPAQEESDPDLAKLDKLLGNLISKN